MGWWDTIYTAAWTALPISGGLFRANAPLYAEDDLGPSGYLVGEPTASFREVPWDATLPYKHRPGNQGCPDGFYTSFEVDAPNGKVCRPMAGYNPTDARKVATTFSGGLIESFGQSLKTTVDSVGATASSIIPNVKSSAYIIIAVLVAGAVLLLAGSRFLGKVEGR